ncbi:hypothetical protein B0H17DRAFT_1140196 [Mycena rosella]|uniref:Uncharacterized protein n=1 Tax=Mycena rosella TaxID=1033263 RepID=A0AAD7D2L3_MYCRO|nr:hypothetical protein B0H17DRAFT_1140196 [Mycena rosella]
MSSATSQSPDPPQTDESAIGTTAQAYLAALNTGERNASADRLLQTVLMVRALKCPYEHRSQLSTGYPNISSIGAWQTLCHGPPGQPCGGDYPKALTLNAVAHTALCTLRFQEAAQDDERVAELGDTELIPELECLLVSSASAARASTSPLRMIHFQLNGQQLQITYDNACQVSRNVAGHGAVSVLSGSTTGQVTSDLEDLDLPDLQPVKNSDDEDE